MVARSGRWVVWGFRCPGGGRSKLREEARTVAADDILVGVGELLIGEKEKTDDGVRQLCETTGAGG
jgi:hypothetical protein